ncbi:MAG TPA: carboxypeptidase M32 [Alphaproteobacteria bacterium]|jgi:carboxypeptidase Taq|nr:carboxypeptidase M32 [Alphaproteobacteria bacterium]
MKPFTNKTILKILDYYKNLWALSYTSAIAHWDLETYMPSLGSAARGEALGRISVIRQKMFLDPEFVNLIHKASAQGGLTDQEKGVVRILLRSLKYYEKLPGDFIEDFEKLTNTATVVWREAKLKNNFKLFQPYLTKIFDYNRQVAEYLGYRESPYDALLDQYEEQLTAKTVELFFDEIRTPLKDLLTKITNSKNYKKTHFVENAKYDRQKMVELNQKVLKYLWPEINQNFRLDVSSHPFTTSFSNSDTRITTWYHEKDFARSLLATIHEFGHALYDLQSADELEMTPIAGGSSLVIHESQSRFWENFIGRSREFIEKFLPDIQKTVHSSRLTVDDVYSYFNKVSPGTLRVEADEITYHFHIMLRFEIEKGIIEGKLKVKDLPEIWNSKMKEYLGIVPKGDSDGSLQDIHWSGGSVGYFPTYSLGTFLGAQFEQKIGKNDPKTWLKNHVHKFGSTYTLQDLLKKNKMKFDPQVNLEYLKKKY